MLQLQLETTNHCNAMCIFCAYPSMKRKKGIMTMDLYKKIVDEASVLPLITRLTITGLGEPLLDKMLHDRIDYAAVRLPAIEHIDIYTNGSLLTDEFVYRVIGKVTTLYVSVNSYSARQRAEQMKLNDFDKVVAQTRRAIEICKGTRTRVTVKVVLGKDLWEPGEIDEFINQWGGMWNNGGNAFVHFEGNWAGSTWKMRTKPRQACERALYQIMVLWDGRVSLCCMDAEGGVILGDANKQSIKEIFNSELATGIRRAHMEGRRSELDLCKDCTSI